MQQAMQGEVTLIRVLVVDDHQLVRTGISRLLADVEGLEIVGQADSGEEALDMIQAFNPHVVLMDVQMPGIGGLEATRRALRIDPEIKVIAVTVYDDEPFPSRLLNAGAVGYLTKTANVDEMVTAIKSVCAGKRYISNEIAQQLALKPYSGENGSPFDTLSSREMQITLMVISGMRVQEISENLSLSPKTVNSYRYRIFEKLNVKNDVGLTKMSIKHGVIDAEAVAGSLG
jgi:DNA-binding NarL/FixJ family response regulator